MKYALLSNQPIIKSTNQPIISQDPLLKFQAFRHSQLRRHPVLSRPAHDATIKVCFSSNVGKPQYLSTTFGCAETPME
jgi:hypothetical protein